MSFTAGSLEDVESWAKHEFPAYFAEVANGPYYPNFDMSSFGGEYMDGDIVLRRMLVSTLYVGDMATGEIVYARISKYNNVELFSVQGVYAPAYPIKTLEYQYMKPIRTLADVELDAPFKYPIETGHPDGIDRFKTLIWYMYLKSGEKSSVQPELDPFKAHFRAACRDVARGQGTPIEGDEMDDNDTLPDDSPPDLIADTDIAGLHDNPTATSIFSEHVHAMDESYHDFKSRMLTQLGAMQKIDRNELAQLQVQIQDLGRKLAVSEEGRVKLAKELEVEKVKTKKVSEEMVTWKTQYEGLRNTLQGALGQQR